MRIPKVHDYHMENAEQQSEVIEVDIKPYEYLDDLGLFDDPKETLRFIVRTKYYIRKSYEYTRLMKFLKHFRGMNCCGVHPNITTYDGFSINIHHTPLVMEDIVHIIIAKRLKCEEDLKQSSIAKEVMMLHYMGLIGLYPLCDVCHGYAHGDTNDLFIPLDNIFGDPKGFFDIYDEFISEMLKNKFDNIKTLSDGYGIIKNEIPQSLIRKYIYVTTKGQEVMSMKALYDFIEEVNK